MFIKTKYLKNLKKAKTGLIVKKQSHIYNDIKGYILNAGETIYVN